MLASFQQHFFNLVQHLVGLFSLLGEHGVHIGVVARSFQSKGVGELFIVELSISVSVVFVEERLNFRSLEDTAESLETLLELA